MATTQAQKSNNQQDPHIVLDVKPGASPDDIKKAFRKAAMESHPDRNPGDKAAEARMKEVNVAYEALKKDSHPQGGRTPRDTGPTTKANSGPDPGDDFDFAAERNKNNRAAFDAALAAYQEGRGIPHPKKGYYADNSVYDFWISINRFMGMGTADSAAAFLDRPVVGMVAYSNIPQDQHRRLMALWTKQAQETLAQELPKLDARLNALNVKFEELKAQATALEADNTSKSAAAQKELDALERARQPVADFFEALARHASDINDTNNDVSRLQGELAKIKTQILNEQTLYNSGDIKNYIDSESRFMALFNKAIKEHNGKRGFFKKKEINPSDSMKEIWKAIEEGRALEHFDAFVGQTSKDSQQILAEARSELVRMVEIWQKAKAVGLADSLWGQGGPYLYSSISAATKRETAIERELAQKQGRFEERVLQKMGALNAVGADNLRAAAAVLPKTQAQLLHAIANGETPSETDMLKADPGIGANAPFIPSNIFGVLNERAYDLGSVIRSIYGSHTEARGGRIISLMHDIHRCGIGLRNVRPANVAEPADLYDYRSRLDKAQGQVDALCANPLMKETPESHRPERTGPQSTQDRKNEI